MRAGCPKIPDVYSNKKILWYDKHNCGIESTLSDHTATAIKRHLHSSKVVGWQVNRQNKIYCYHEIVGFAKTVVARSDLTFKSQPWKSSAGRDRWREQRIWLGSTAAELLNFISAATRTLIESKFRNLFNTSALSASSVSRSTSKGPFSLCFTATWWFRARLRRLECPPNRRVWIFF